MRWHDPAARHDPTVAVKLLGINDFHGQLSPRTLGPPTALRPVGGAAVLASYLEAAADQAGGPAFVIHAGDQVGAPLVNRLIGVAQTAITTQIDLLLEQQWINQNPPKILKISGLTFTWDAARPIGARVIEIRDAGGNALDPNATYRVAVNSFLATGGDNFVVLNSGTHRVVGAVDLDALVEYVQALPDQLAGAGRKKAGKLSSAA